MSEHIIRLRAAWTGEFGADAVRVDLPRIWEDKPPGRFRLRRSFHLPRFDPARERLFLRAGSVPGVTAIRLDRRELKLDGQPSDPWEWPLADLSPARHEIEIEVDPALWTSLPALWGEISLVIRSGESVA